MFLVIISLYNYDSVTYAEIRTSGICPYFPRQHMFCISIYIETSSTWLTFVVQISETSVLAPQMVWSPLDNDLFECTVNWFLIMSKFKYLNAIFGWVNEHTLAVICAWGSLVKLLLNNDISKKILLRSNIESERDFDAKHFLVTRMHILALMVKIRNR